MDENNVPSSKKKLRKLEKFGGAEGMRAFWQKKKEAKKERKKTQNAERKEAQNLAWDQLSEEEQKRRRERALAVHTLRHEQQSELLDRCRINMGAQNLPYIVFDMSFVDDMTDRDKRSTLSQLKFSYSILKKFGFTLRPIFTSFVDKAPFDGFQEFGQFSAFQPRFTDSHWSETVCRENVVFLTADSDNVLTNLSSDTYYIVGAFVDHNSKKGATLDASKKYGVRTARLPLDEEMDVGNLCKVLTINHVTEVMCSFAASGSWAEALSVLPTRRK